MKKLVFELNQCIGYAMQAASPKFDVERSGATIALLTLLDRMRKEQLNRLEESDSEYDGDALEDETRQCERCGFTLNWSVCREKCGRNKGVAPIDTERPPPKKHRRISLDEA